MKKLKPGLLSLLLATTLTSQAYATCDVPGAPIIPDGNVASMDELLAAQKAMKAYQASLVEQRECLDKISNAIAPEDEGAAEDQAALLEAYNASVTSEESIAAEFNAAVRAFKARGN